MPNVLVVDDSAVDRRLVCGLFERDKSLSVKSAVDGEDALAKIEEEAPDLVVTDLVMPKVDGLKVVEEIKRRWPAVPVVLMTSRGNEEIATEALTRGAAGYVSKSRLEKDLIHTVKNLLTITAGRTDFAYVMEQMMSFEYSLVTSNDWSRINTIVRFLQDGVAYMGLLDHTDRTRLGVALTEALFNAILHGNLDIGSEIREEGLIPFFELARSRSQESPYRDRRVFVEATCSRSDCRFVIRDEGKGFDVAALPDPTDPANLERASGRGVRLMQMFMDEVTFNEAGNEVTMFKRRDSDAAAAISTTGSKSSV